jgi:hypothetical protein
MVSSSGGARRTVQENVADQVDDDQAATDQTPVVEVGPADDEPSLTRDDLFEALDNRRRRYTIHYLQECDGDGPADLSDVSTQVAAWELDEDPDQIGYSDRKNVHTALYQFHAPKLDTLGLVEYNKRRGTIELTDHGERLWVDISCETDDRERPRHVPVALAGGALALALATWLALPTAGPTVVVPLLVALGVGFAGGAWYADSRPGARSVVEEHLPTTVDDD